MYTVLYEAISPLAMNTFGDLIGHPERYTIMGEVVNKLDEGDIYEIGPSNFLILKKAHIKTTSGKEIAIVKDITPEPEEEVSNENKRTN